MVNISSSVGLVWLVAAVVLFVLSLAIVALFLVTLPADYFVDEEFKPLSRVEPPILRYLALFLKNLLGATSIVIGLIMLFTPGQGVLAILIGIMLLDFPGKRNLERKLIRKPTIYNSINRLRQRFGRKPIVIP